MMQSIIFHFSDSAKKYLSEHPGSEFKVRVGGIHPENGVAVEVRMPEDTGPLYHIVMEQPVNTTFHGCSFSVPERHIPFVNGLVIDFEESSGRLVPGLNPNLPEGFYHTELEVNEILLTIFRSHFTNDAIAVRCINQATFYIRENGGLEEVDPNVLRDAVGFGFDDYDQ